MESLCYNYAVFCIRRSVVERELQRRRVLNCCFAAFQLAFMHFLYYLLYFRDQQYQLLTQYPFQRFWWWIGGGGSRAGSQLPSPIHVLSDKPIINLCMYIFRMLTQRTTMVNLTIKSRLVLNWNFYN